MNKSTTGKELEEMLERDNLAIFISDVSGIQHLFFWVTQISSFCRFEAIYMIIQTAWAFSLSQLTSDSQISSQALTEIELRHQEILCLESSIKDLHKIFVDTAMMLELQVKQATSPGINED